MRYETEKLLEVLEFHNTIIVGVDFDDTIFPLSTNNYIIERCSKVVELIKSLKDVITICLYTVADNQSIAYKKQLMKEWEIPAAYVNESPVTLGNGAKPYFNILLDDKAGLNETIEILTEFKNYLLT